MKGTISSSFSCVQTVPISWERRKNENKEVLPIKKNHSMIYYKESIIIFGGFDGKRENNDLIKYDLITDKWKTEQLSGDYIKPRNGHSATLVPPNKMFIIGGWLNIGPFASNEIFSINLDTFYTSKFHLKKGQKFGPTNMHTCDYYPKKNLLILFIGGNGISYFNQLIFISLEKATCDFPETKGIMPCPRANHGSCISQENYFIFGGWNGETLFNDLYLLNLQTLNWVKIINNSDANWPCRRAGMTMMNYKDDFFVFFGGSGTDFTYLNDVWVYNVQSKSWFQGKETTHSEPPPLERSGQSGIVAGDTICIYGGGTSGNYYNDVVFLKINPSPVFDWINLVNPRKIATNEIKKYFNNKFLSDIIIISTKKEKKKIYAHYFILSIFSEFFKERGKEKQQVIYDKENEYSSIFFAVKFCYDNSEVARIPENIDSILEILKVAKIYKILRLQVELIKVLTNKINQGNVLLVLKVGKEFELPFLTKYCYWYIRKNLSFQINNQENYYNFDN